MNLASPLNITPRFDRHRLEIALPVPLLLKDRDQRGIHLSLEVLVCRVTHAASRRGLCADADRFSGPNLATRPKHLRRLPSGLDGSRLEHVPVRDQHMSLGEPAHQVGRYQVTCTVETCFTTLRLEFLEAGFGS